MAEESDWAFKYEDNGSVWNNLHSCFPLVPSVKQQAALTRQAGLRPNQGQHKLTVMLDAPYFPSLQGVKETIHKRAYRFERVGAEKDASNRIHIPIRFEASFYFYTFSKRPPFLFKRGATYFHKVEALQTPNNSLNPW